MEHCVQGKYEDAKNITETLKIRGFPQGCVDDQIEMINGYIEWIEMINGHERKKIKPEN